jgi:prevent-host-death family protein
MTRTVGAYEAKTKLSELLAEVEAGGEVVITKHGRAVARLLPPLPPKRSRSEVLAEIREMSAGRSLGGLSIRELIDEGRRH